MKKIYSLFVLLFLTINIANAGLLPVGGYIGIRGGTSSGGLSSTASVAGGAGKAITESKPHVFGSVNAGLRLSLPFFNTFRIEAEGLGRYNGLNLKLKGSDDGSKVLDQDISSVSGLVNVYYDVIDLPFIRGFVGGGIGYTKFTTDFVKNIGGGEGAKVEMTKDGALAYNIGVGVTATLLDILSVDVGWRYFNQGEFKLKIGDTTAKLDAVSSDIYAGVRIGF
ncbi:MAG: hypothetical protein LBT02_03635 [Rickettsiales bacterium]|jgi:opacity protein-like surface antigen|nr:hypothetical protein [Rickettsiales bacterium]